jgi:DtxR family transcriptional regulator, Mn-dependent transcriptional regulator
MSAPHLSESTEMYLKAMAELGDSEVVAIGRLAERLDVTPVSANEMVKRLGDQGLVSHTPYKGVNLTRKGRKAASNVVRKQRLWECFLHDHLKIEWAQLYELACSLEHATAPEVTNALSDFLGDPKTCPHGNPIPAADGSVAPLNGFRLSEVSVGSTIRVLAIRTTAADVFKYLQERNIMPGREMTLLEVAPMEGPLTLDVEGNHVALGLLLSKFVIVEMKSFS